MSILWWKASYENLTDHQRLVAFLTLIGAPIGRRNIIFASPTNLFFLSLFLSLQLIFKWNCHQAANKGKATANSNSQQQQPTATANHGCSKQQLASLYKRAIIKVEEINTSEPKKKRWWLLVAPLLKFVSELSSVHQSSTNILLEPSPPRLKFRSTDVDNNKNNNKNNNNKNNNNNALSTSRDISANIGALIGSASTPRPR